MPLLDHFHPPLYPGRHWESFHAQWAASIASALNGSLLPSGYFAETQTHVGSRVEVDVATFEGNRSPSPAPSDGGGVATMTAPAKVWAPPSADFVMPGVFPDSVEVLLFNTEAGLTLVAAVELVSPGNKDRAETRRAFAAKCASYLQQGIGLMIVDIVTNRQANLHNELVDLLEVGPAYHILPDPLYATAYRPIRRPNADQIEVWHSAITIGGPLPLLPLPLDKGQVIPLDLEPTYAEACQRSRLG